MNGSSTGQVHSRNGNHKHLKSCEPSVSKDQPRHRPLTFLRALRGLLCLLILLSTAFPMLVYIAPITTLLFRLFSVHYSRKATSALFATWLSLWPFLFEKINKTKVVFSGETVPKNERVLLFANHRTEVDWMYLWDLALRKGCLGYIKYMLKSSLMKLPVFGWGFQILEFIPVERKWGIDEHTLQKKLSNLQDPQDPLWLVVFPEGTDYTEAKCIKSQNFAVAKELPILQNVLLPKTRGFNTCLQTLRNSLDAVYDVTIAYKHRCPTFIDNVFGVDPAEVHIHVQRFSLNEIPSSEKVEEWLIERFRLKDQLLSEFTASGYFPCQGTEGPLSTFTCLIKCSLVLAITTILLYVTLFSSIWFKVYLAFSCAYLSTLTYFDIQTPTVVNFIKALQIGKKNL